MSIFKITDLPYTMRLLEALGADMAPPIGDTAVQPPAATPQMDPQDQVPDIDHPANHPAVQAAHKGFIEIHDALAENPCAENIMLFDQAWAQLKGALETYVPGCEPGGGDVAPEEMEGEEAEQLGPPGMPNQAPEAEMEDDGAEEAPPAAAPKAAAAEEDDDEDEDEPKRESNPYSKMSAQLNGVETMNTWDASDSHKAKICYNSESDTPWHIDTGKTKLSPGFETRNEAEAAFAQWMAQSQQHQEMYGKQDRHSSELIPAGSPNENGSKYKSVMGGEKQNFKPPYTGTPAGSSGGSYTEAKKELVPGELYKKNQNRNHTPENLMEQQQTKNAESAAFSESGLSKCSMCDGAGCGVCETGYVNKDEARAIREATRAYGSTYGNTLMAAPQLPNCDFNEEAQSEKSEDPMTQVWALMRQARTAR